MTTNTLAPVSGIDHRAIVRVGLRTYDVPQALADALEAEGLVYFRDDARCLYGRYVPTRNNAAAVMARVAPTPAPAVVRTHQAMSAEDALASLVRLAREYDARLTDAPEGSDYAVLFELIRAAEALARPAAPRA